MHEFYDSNNIIIMTIIMIARYQKLSSDNYGTEITMVKKNLCNHVT